MGKTAEKILAERVTLGYRTKRDNRMLLACRDLSLGIESGTFVSIVGPSGCGKTTFLHALAGLVPVVRGRLLVDGRPIDGPARDRALVFQSASLFPWRTTWSNIIYGLQLQGKVNPQTLNRARALVDLVGLHGFEHSYPSQLSGGMQQRANLARALAVDPQVLLLDEPFASVDAQTRELLQLEMARVWQRTGVVDGQVKTAVFVTHDITEAVFLADEVIVFSFRPAQVRRVIRVDLPRPRDAALKRSPEILRYVDEIWSLIMDEGPAEGAS